MRQREHSSQGQLEAGENKGSRRYSNLTEAAQS